jgi:YtxH-like protein
MNLRDLTDRLSTQDLARLFRVEPDRSQSESLLGSLALLGAGALIGATVALFLAPKPGAQFREELREQLRSTGEKIASVVGARPGKPRES